MKKIITDSIQFGEGNFLRAFVDYCIQILNEKTAFSGKVNIVQPLRNGMIEQLKNKTENTICFTRESRKEKNIRERQQIECINEMINPYNEFRHFLKLAEK